MADAFQKQCWTPTDQPGAGSVLIVKDDKQPMHCLARAMEARGFKIALAQIELSAPEYVDMTSRPQPSFNRKSATALTRRRPDARAIILTGYGNIATAVRAIKLGAVDYLTKPADVNDIVSTLVTPKGIRGEAPLHPMSPARVRWEHILQVHGSCGRNVSETSRRLNMHRRTLQRILARGQGFQVR